MPELTLPEKTLKLWKIRLTVSSILFFCLFSYFFHSYFWFLPVFIIAICIFELLLLWYIPQLFKSYKIKFVSGAVIVNSGVIIRITHIMPFSKLIYTQTITTPLAKLMGLKALTLKAARSRILVPELKDADVERFAAVLAGSEK